jgi:hypothetical protein
LQVGVAVAHNTEVAAVRAVYCKGLLLLHQVLRTQLLWALAEPGLRVLVEVQRIAGVAEIILYLVQLLLLAVAVADVMQRDLTVQLIKTVRLAVLEAVLGLGKQGRQLLFTPIMVKPVQAM